jgi:hypothetical protein
MPPRRTRGLVETDLSPPVRTFLEAQGFTVRSEVQHCDITAVRGKELVVVELKCRFDATLLHQAAKRQQLTDSVYVALPRPVWNRHWRSIRLLLRRLELGLLLVSPNPRRPAVEVAFHPLPYTRQRRKRAVRAVLREIEGRSGDFNEGGSRGRKLATAYRENAIHIACCLERFGPLRPAQLRALGTGLKTLSILSANFYGWFERVDRGLYALRPQGAAGLKEFPPLTRRYRTLVQRQPAPQ